MSATLIEKKVVVRDQSGKMESARFCNVPIASVPDGLFFSLAPNGTITCNASTAANPIVMALAWRKYDRLCRSLPEQIA